MRERVRAREQWKVAGSSRSRHPPALTLATGEKGVRDRNRGSSASTNRSPRARQRMQDGGPHPFAREGKTGGIKGIVRMSTHTRR